MHLQNVYLLLIPRLVLVLVVVAPGGSTRVVGLRTLSYQPGHGRLGCSRTGAPVPPTAALRLHREGQIPRPRWKKSVLVETVARFRWDACEIQHWGHAC